MANPCSQQQSKKAFQNDPQVMGINQTSFPGFVSVAIEQLESLYQTQGITGYCLITSNGYVCTPARGPLAEELGVTVDIATSATSPCPPSAAVSQFLRPFTSLQPTISFNALGVRLQVIRQEEGSVFALGPRRRVGLGACLLPQGVAVVTFDRTLPPHTAVSVTERCAATIRARCATA